MAKDEQVRQSAKGLSRREFLVGLSATTAGIALVGCGGSAPSSPPAPTSAAGSLPAATSAPAAAAATSAPAVKTARKLHFLRGSSFVGAEDKWFSDYLKENWAKPNNVDLTVETVSTADMTAKISVALETGVGPEIIRLAWDEPLLYGPKMSDVSTIAEKQAADGGGFFDNMKAFCFDKSLWRAVPWGMVGTVINYRSDWLKEVGETKFPDTYTEYNRVGKLMKQKKNAPIGLPLGHTTGDPRHALYPLLWAYGGKEVLEDGKTVAINSKETLACLEFFAEFFRDSLSPEMLGWDDNGNNKAFLGEQIWATNNAASLYLDASAKFPELAKATDMSLNPAGPAGRFHTAGPHSFAIPSYVKDPAAAKELLAFLSQPKVFADFMKVSKGYTSPAVKIHSKDPIWDVDPKMAIFKDLTFYKWPGYPGMPSPRSAEVVNKFIVIDMFAKVAQGTKPQEAMQWCEAQIAPIYGKA